MAVALPCPYPAHDLEAFLADIGFGYGTPPPTPADLSQDPMAVMVTSPEEEEETSAGSGVVVASAGDDDDKEKRLRRKISNRESARRSRERKQRHVEEQRTRAASLRAVNRDLAARLRGARAGVALVALANARLRAEAAALGRRLAAAGRALALRQLYAAASAPGGAGLDMQTLASLIA